MPNNYYSQKEYFLILLRKRNRLLQENPRCTEQIKNLEGLMRGCQVDPELKELINA